MISEMDNSICISTFETADDQDNLSIKYTNLYYINGQFVYLTCDKSTNPPYVNKWTNTYGWRPEIKIFDTEEDLANYVNTLTLKVVDCALLSDNLWYGNIGHALFDGFYPVYLAAVKFGYQDKPFIYLADNWSNPRVTANQAITLFSGYPEIWSYPKLQGDFMFKTLISGTGRTGNRVMNEEYTLYGSKYDGLQHFKRRMMENCGATPNKPLNSPIKAVIISNKRYSPKEWVAVNQVIKHYENNPDISLSVLDWSTITTFQDQMQVLQDIDIHITGPGTGMMYMPFLKNGAVNINLGYMEHTQTNTARPNIKIPHSTKADHILPGWMEQSVCAGANYVSTLYYDRFTYNSIQYAPLIFLIDKAIKLVQNKEVLENNHNTDAQVFIEYCKRVPNARQVCDHLTSIAFFIELFVNEHPQAVPTDLVDVRLLRNIKDELDMDRRYEIKL